MSSGNGPAHGHLQVVVDDSTSEKVALQGSGVHGAVKVLQYRWDTDLLEWVRDGGGSTGGESGFSFVPLDMRYEFVGGNPVYLGYNSTANADTASLTWRIYKFSWDADGNPTRKQGYVLGAWDNRASLF
jgi:hypothetical protein